MQRRKELVEHPFGTIKWYDGAHYFLCKGKEMVSAEIALSFLTYNLRRAIRILGVGALVAHFNARKQKNGAVSKWLKQAMRGSAFFRNIFGQAKTECRKNGTQGIIFIRNFQVE